MNSIDYDHGNKLEDLYKNLTNEDSILELLKLEIENIKISVKMLEQSSKVSEKVTLDMFRECNKIIDSLIMYEWIRFKKNEDIKEVIINNKRV